MDNDPPPPDPRLPGAPLETLNAPEPTPDEGDAEVPTADPFIGPRGGPRRRFESFLVRIVATCGIIGIAVALAAILGTQDIAAWVIGLAVSTLSVVLAAVLWSSRML